MLTEKQIMEDIQAKKEVFNRSIYAGDVPAGLVKIFSEAVFLNPPVNLKLKVSKLREMMKKKEGDLTNFELSIMTNLIVGTPLYLLHENLEAALDKQEEINAFMAAYNLVLNQNEEAWRREFDARVRLIRGVAKETPSGILR